MASLLAKPPERTSPSPSPSPSQSSGAPTQGIATQKANRKTVLIVEDDACTRELLVRTLSMEFQVHAAASGEEALQDLQGAIAPDAIVTDVMMPGIDGLQLARAIKALPSCKGVPLMFLTARDAPGDIVAGINAGARHYMTKPFKVDALLEKIRKMTQR